MAELVSLIGTTHHPWYYAKTSRPDSQLTDEGRDFLGWSGRVQQALRAADPDALVIIASDHFHQFFYDNMPAFLVGRMDRYEGTFANEVREFGLPRCHVQGDRRLAGDVIEGGFQRGLDFSFSDEMRLDHAVVVPLLIGTPSMDIPVVPVMTNCGAPPIPPADRFVLLGEVLREAIEASNAVDRVAVLVSGNLSLEVGGPEQIQPHPCDPEFDAAAMKWLKERDIERLTHESTFERMMSHGNTTFQFLNLLSMVGMAQPGMTCTHAEAMARRGSSAPCFIYESEVMR